MSEKNNSVPLTLDEKVVGTISFDKEAGTVKLDIHEDLDPDTLRLLEEHIRIDSSRTNNTSYNEEETPYPPYDN